MYLPLFRLKDCQAWYVNDNNLCRKRPLVSTDATDLAGYLRYDAINKVVSKLMEDISVNQGRQAYTGWDIISLSSSRAS